MNPGPLGMAVVITYPSTYSGTRDLHYYVGAMAADQRSCDDIKSTCTAYVRCWQRKLLYRPSPRNSKNRQGVAVITFYYIYTVPTQGAFRRLSVLIELIRSGNFLITSSFEDLQEISIQLVYTVVVNPAFLSSTGFPL